MTFHFIVDHARLNPATFYTKWHEVDGIEEIGVQIFGSVFQLVDERLLYRMDAYGKRLFEYHFASLHRYEVDMRCSWYMRRGKRLLPWRIAWYACSAWEWLNWRTMWIFYRTLPEFFHEGERPSWNSLLDAINQGRPK